MNTAIINVKINPTLKKQAQSIAEELGINLSSLIKAYLKQLVRTKTLVLTAAEEEPTGHLLESLRESKEDIKAGRISSAFTSVEEATKWLRDKKRKYANQIC